MAAYEFREATQEDIELILNYARQENIDELQLVDNLDLRTALVGSLGQSTEAYVAVIDGDPVCAFGVVETDHPGVGRPWMVGTSTIDKHGVAFLRASRAVIAELAARWPLLVNVADARNTRGLRWLRFMGFTIHEPEPMGQHNLMFHRFEKRSH